MGTRLTVVLHCKVAEGSSVVVTCLKVRISYWIFFLLVMQGIMG